MSKGTGQKRTPEENHKQSRPGDGDPQVDPAAGPAVEEDAAEAEALGIEEGPALTAKVDELTRERDELLDNLIRLKAEFENYRKRMVREQTRILETAEAELVRKLLPVVDNLERAFANSGGLTEGAGLRKGVGMVLEQLLGVLEKEGLEVVDPEGEPFDPECHEAMMVVETNKCPEDTVLEVVQKGYRFNGLLLRPAMVKVSCPVSGTGD